MNVPFLLLLASAWGQAPTLAPGELPAAVAAPAAPAPPAATAPRAAPSTMREVVEALASDRMGGRGPGSPGSALARRLIIERLRAAGLSPAGEGGGWEQAVEKRAFGNRIGTNVVGKLAGRSAPGECVYIDAHYDHWGRAGGRLQPGANDNASGVAVMLELARLLAARGTDRTVVFLASDYEEGAAFPHAGGLKGAAAHLREPACPASSIRAALVLDMLGGRFVPGVPPRLFLLGSESSPELHALVERAARRSRVPLRRLGVSAIEPAGPRIPRADYGPFRDSGVPFIFATTGIPPEYHTPADTPDNLDYAFMGRAAETLAGLVAAMARADFEPRFSEKPEEVLDLETELGTLDGFLDDLASLPRPTERQREALAKLRADRARLEQRLPYHAPAMRRLAVQRTLSNAVYELMGMNGSLHLWDHIIREHE